MTADTGNSRIVDHDAAEVTFHRVHEAPASLVFACMTQPEHLTHFWGPEGTTTPIENIVVDLRPGGAFETTMVNDADGQTYTMRAVYVEVDPPSRLVFKDADGDMTTSITFTDLGDGRCEVVTHQTNVPPMFRSDEALAGFETSLVRGDAYIAKLAAASRSVPAECGVM